MATLKNAVVLTLLGLDGVLLNNYDIQLELH